VGIATSREFTLAKSDYFLFIIPEMISVIQKIESQEAQENPLPDGAERAQFFIHHTYIFI
jgi:hypothetical protein